MNLNNIANDIREDINNKQKTIESLQKEVKDLKIRKNELHNLLHSVYQTASKYVNIDSDAEIFIKWLNKTLDKFGNQL